MLVKFCEKIFLPKTQHFILAVIVFNAIILGLETSGYIMDACGPLIVWLDKIALGIFVIELLMKITVLRLSFFKDPWNVFDFVVVGIALVPSSGPLAILRSLRILRVLRLVSAIPRLRVITESVFRALPSLGWLFILMFLIFYVFAVLTTSLFGGRFSEWFGSVGESLYTLFQMMTLDGWSMGITRPIMEVFPEAYLLFIPFIIISSFIVLNVFIGIIVGTMSAVAEAEKERQAARESEERQEVMYEFNRLKEQLAKIEALLAMREEEKKISGN